MVRGYNFYLEQIKFYSKITSEYNVAIVADKKSHHHDVYVTNGKERISIKNFLIKKRFEQNENKQNNNS